MSNLRGDFTSWVQKQKLTKRKVRMILRTTKREQQEDSGKEGLNNTRKNNITKTKQEQLAVKTYKKKD